MIKIFLAASAALFLSGCVAMVPAAIIGMGTTAGISAETGLPGPATGFAKLCDLGGGQLEANGDCTAPWSDNYTGV